MYENNNNNKQVINNSSVVTLSFKFSYCFAYLSSGRFTRCTQTLFALPFADEVKRYKDV